jgi:hypothetical protein
VTAHPPEATGRDETIQSSDEELPAVSQPRARNGEQWQPILVDGAQAEAMMALIGSERLVVDELRAFDLNNATPMDALIALSKWQKELKSPIA